MFLRIPEAHSRSLLKAVTWRVVGSVDTFVISFFVIGKLHPHASAALEGAAWIAFIETFTKILIYYFHERIWATVPQWGVKKAPEQQSRSAERTHTVARSTSGS